MGSYSRIFSLNDSVCNSRFAFLQYAKKLAMGTGRSRLCIYLKQKLGLFLGLKLSDSSELFKRLVGPKKCPCLPSSYIKLFYLQIR